MKPVMSETLLHGCLSEPFRIRHAFDGQNLGASARRPHGEALTALRLHARHICAAHCEDCRTDMLPADADFAAKIEQ